MIQSWPKTPRIRLCQAAYARLHRQVLERDGWRCQGCGSCENLALHHKKFRSHSGHDAEENLITLCAHCHAELHANLLS